MKKIIILLILLFLLTSCSTLESVEWQEKTYLIKKGDTLWSISQDYCPDNVDTYEWIEQVKKLNGLQNSNICAGDTLVVLVPVGEGDAE